MAEFVAYIDAEGAGYDTNIKGDARHFEPTEGRMEQGMCIIEQEGIQDGQVEVEEDIKQFFMILGVFFRCGEISGRLGQELFEQGDDDESHIESTRRQGAFKINTGESRQWEQVSDKVFYVFPHGINR